MCSEIVVLNRIDAEYFESDDRWACISIANREDDFADIQKRSRVALLQVAFADIVHRDPKLIRFDDDHAHDILDFITHHWNRIRTLMIHCDAGISRSSAVAAAIGKLKFGDGSDFCEEPFQPNPHVFQTLLEVAGGREDYAAQ